jgi:hypothetical protein
MGTETRMSSLVAIPFRNSKSIVPRNTHTKVEISSNVTPTYNLADTVLKGRAAWKSLHTKRRLTPEWLSEWEATIPYDCECGNGYKFFKKSVQPQFLGELEDFAWGLELHNFVNTKLERPRWTLDEALAIWRPDLKDNVVSKPREATIVTSFYKSNLEVQLDCLDSWQRSGFNVVSVNLSSEIEQLKPIFKNVEFQLGEPSLRYHKQTPKIHSLLTAKVSTPYKLMLNSDIKIYYPIDAFMSQAFTLGIRRNYYDTPMDGDIERWGIDAFLLPEEICGEFPNLDFAIGQPMFDYWIPWHLEQMGIELRWFAEPLFFHKTHSINWKNEALQIGWDIIDEHYSSGEDWELWRLNRPHHDASQKEAILKNRYNVGIDNPTLSTKEKTKSTNASL